MNQSSSYTLSFYSTFYSRINFFLFSQNFALPKKLGNTESVLIACCACEKVAFSGHVLQHVHLADGEVEAAVTEQGWECHCKSPLR